MTIICAVKFCNSKMSLTKKISYFRFPSDQLRCKQWMGNCHTVHLLNKDPAILYKNYRVCCVHFEDNMFLNPSSRNRLTMNAVPTIFSERCI
ncbi:52 kDa repressor of the inhibitor of the protein kinase-like [Acyrthosiphon pisum]|uniref:THAP-type domain-containing protein n=1 Tax=Acyrthosiphon pisum TaxID=7029 RepID=A0A8R2NMM4_ACYPI|nr:52 kDa repressor of the inhibitor of the protein kinase-like [Acyrthosiphon pisum]